MSNKTGNLSSMLRQTLCERRGVIDSNAVVRVSAANLSMATPKRSLASQNATPLPNCPLWVGGVERANYETGVNTEKVNCSMQKHDVLAHKARPSLPIAALLPVNSKVGPAGTMEAELKTMERCSSISFRKVCESRPPVVATRPRVCNDAATQQVDNIRMWPPQGMKTEDEIAAMTMYIDNINKQLGMVDEIVAKKNGAGTYAKIIQRVLASDSIDDAEFTTLDFRTQELKKKDRRNFLGLGICIFGRDPSAMAEATDRAGLLAVVAYASGARDLGRALEKLFVKLKLMVSM